MPRYTLDTNRDGKLLGIQQYDIHTQYVQHAEYGEAARLWLCEIMKRDREARKILSREAARGPRKRSA